MRKIDLHAAVVVRGARGEGGTGPGGRRKRHRALAACVYINHWLGRPSRSLVVFVAWRVESIIYGRQHRAHRQARGLAGDAAAVCVRYSGHIQPVGPRPAA